MGIEVTWKRRRGFARYIKEKKLSGGGGARSNGIDASVIVGLHRPTHQWRKDK